MIEIQIVLQSQLPDLKPLLIEIQRVVQNQPGLRPPIIEIQRVVQNQPPRLRPPITEIQRVVQNQLLGLRPAIIEKGRAKSAALSKAYYERDIATSHVCKRQKYVLLCDTITYNMDML